MVNLILAYSLWGPKGELDPGEPTARSQLVQLRTRLDERGLILPNAVTLPTTPHPMRFLRVEFRPNPTKAPPVDEPSEGAPAASRLRSRYDAAARETVLEPVDGAGGTPVDLSDRLLLRQVAEDFLRANGLFPHDVQLSGIFLRENGAMVEFVPTYDGLPVFSGYLRVYLSPQGVERVAHHWVEPVGFKPGAPKAVRAASEALLRLAGHLEPGDGQVRTIVDVRLGYYSGPSVTVPGAEEISAWETVPVWRITLDNGQVYYVNAFNGELES
ncbi:hypothetical protein STH3305 [Symbiobacterium thermophilum IAM 14863]|uniref:Regulatory protein YycH-like domain-containing protein n=1 Tax=Symbiobacterium thermophilum (strain DSM 24528 / JCM 14929 / IAM 14863 / T) TaxID=292459 RepID=Q67J64_SYMTH|nr:hypothetical protein STH3305 [Symbiobacterium thermophilum IAM 14863]